VPSGTTAEHGARLTLAWPITQGRCVGD